MIDLGTNLLGRPSPISQIAFVVPDLDAAVTRFVEQFSIGPFRVLRHISFADVVLDGRPAELDISAAFAWRDGVEIELIEQHGKTDSIFTTAGNPVSGIHHVGIRTENLEEEAERLVAAGMRCVQRSRSQSGTLTAFFAGEPWLGLVELIQAADAGAAHEGLKLAAGNWDRKARYLGA